MGNILELFAEKLTKTPKRDSLLKKLQVLAESTIYGSFWRKEALFAEKLTKTPKGDSLLEKLQVLTKPTMFRAPSRNGAHFGTFC